MQYSMKLQVITPRTEAKAIAGKWAAVRLHNHRYEIASVEYATDWGFESMWRENYNYFVAPDGMGLGPFTFRVTDVHGHSVVDSGLPFRPSETVSGSAQFPACD